MNTRPSRSSSIPIPRSSLSSGPNRNIESLISIPQYGSPSRPQRHNAASHAYRSISGSNNNPSASPTRNPHSASISVPARNSMHSFEPRIIRGSGTEMQPSSGSECPTLSQPQLSTSHSHTRRASMTSLRTSNKSLKTQHIARPASVTFSRPAYLEYSSLRHLLQVEVPTSPVSTRRADLSVAARSQPYSAAMSPPSDIDDDSTATPPPRDLHPPPTSPPLATQDTPFRLPTRWSDHHQNLSLSSDGRELTCDASLTGEKDAAAARTAYPIPPACGIYYYEVEILGKEQKARVSLGFTGRGVKFSRLPGWEANSWGYYGDDGHALSADKSGAQYGPPFGTGDIVGCGIDFTTYKAFFTKNGTLIGPVFDSIGRNVDLYPAVGLQHMHEIIRANFGQEPFKYDIDYHVQQQLNFTWNKILSTSLDSTLLRISRKMGPASIASITNDTFEKTSISEEESKPVLNQLVMTYLIHHGYAKTARSLEAQQEANENAITSVPSGSEMDDHDVEMRHSTNKCDFMESDIECRTNIVNHVLGGKIDSAIEAVQKHYPKVLETEDHFIFFKLRCRKFVELILETSEIKKKIKALRERDDRRKDRAETWIDDEMNMDIDDDASVPLPYRPSSNETLNVMTSSYSAHDGVDASELDDLVVQYETALNEAINYGQTLSKNYQSDPRPELQQLCKKTFGIVAWEDPLEAGGSIADIVGHNSRIALAHEVNQAILKSQGRPVQPALETLYRHTSACVTQLGLLGVGDAAFVDMSREFRQA